MLKLLSAPVYSRDGDFGYAQLAISAKLALHCCVGPSGMLSCPPWETEGASCVVWFVGPAAKVILAERGLKQACGMYPHGMSARLPGEHRL